PLPRVLALHLRRGDFEEHCVKLASWNSAWQGLNEAEGVGDRYTPPPGGLKTPAERAEFARRCWPSLDDIMQCYAHDGPSSVMRVEHEGRFIRDSQGEEGVSGDAFSQWVDELDADGEVRSTKRRESERVVGLAVDMEIAARAEVFIGNGWSSFTSNVNLLRMAHGAPRASIRFW
ncbi:hypothetical protein JB92DRAFT_2776847, partial [Gautieria morchelliformis]